MNEFKQSMLVLMMIESGIVPDIPGEYPEASKDSLDKMLAGLSPEEQRKAKRKFRKLWRKACIDKRAPLRQRSRELQCAKASSLSEKSQSKPYIPTSTYKSYRRSLVRKHLMNKKVEPLLVIEESKEDA